MIEIQANIWRANVVYFDQLLGAAPTQKLVKLLFSAVFNLFVNFYPINYQKKRNQSKLTKNVEKSKKINQKKTISG